MLCLRAELRFPNVIRQSNFSEDIDITIDTKLSQGQMKKLKNVIKDVAAELGLSIPNIDETRSRRSYNRYILEYQSVVSGSDDAVQTAVLLETSFAEVSFPTVVLPVHSYIGDMMMTEAPEELENFYLKPFEMKVQGLDRTLADKVFAICDYYMQDRVKKHSRHIYDIYKLLQIVPLTNEYKDYETITVRILEEDVSYEMAIVNSLDHRLLSLVKTDEEADTYMNIVFRLCCEYERQSYIEGMKVGARLVMELWE